MRTKSLVSIALLLMAGGAHAQVPDPENALQIPPMVVRDSVGALVGQVIQFGGDEYGIWALVIFRDGNRVLILTVLADRIGTPGQLFDWVFFESSDCTGTAHLYLPGLLPGILTQERTYGIASGNVIYRSIDGGDTITSGNIQSAWTQEPPLELVPGVSPPQCFTKAEILNGGLGHHIPDTAIEAESVRDLDDLFTPPYRIGTTGE